MRAIIELHNDIAAILVFILFFIFVIISLTLISYHEENNFKNKNIIKLNFKHNSILEIVWTLLPGFLLILMSIPSFILLFKISDPFFSAPSITMKVVGHQWYWSYEFNDYGVIDVSLRATIESRMELVNNQSFAGRLRLMEVDNRICIPKGFLIRVLVTSEDVVHSWALPGLGLKLDAIPGRLNEGWINCSRAATYYGQCSEICGLKHPFMPIVLTVKDDFKDYLEWLKTVLPPKK